jgi:hypothetical protein
MDGILQECGCKAHFATPYRGRSKPIERLFGTIIQLFSKAQDFYTGSNTADAPEERHLYWKRINGRDRIEATYTLEKLREDFGHFATWYSSSALKYRIYLIHYNLWHTMKNLDGA